MIMYCVVTGTSVGDLFKAGVLPGLLILLFFAVYNFFHAKKRGIPRSEAVSIRGKIAAFKNALGPIGFPVVIFVYSGKFARQKLLRGVLYAAILEVVVFRSIKLRDFTKIALSTNRGNNRRLFWWQQAVCSPGRYHARIRKQGTCRTGSRSFGCVF